jgi:hypothetical protein
MKIGLNELTIKVGMQKICESKHYDIRDIKNYYIKECEITTPNEKVQLSKYIKKYKIFLTENFQYSKNDRILELKTKLRGYPWK